jgi:activating signal cointegrator complex subunit 1
VSNVRLLSRFASSLVNSSFFRVKYLLRMLATITVRRAATGPINRRTTVTTATVLLKPFSSQKHTRAGNSSKYQPPNFRPYTTSSTMGKKKISKSEYNDFLDGEKLTDNTEIRTTLQGFAAQAISPPPSTRQSSYQPGGHKEKGGEAKNPPLTHFLCLPLVTEKSRPHLQASLQTFKQDLAKNGPVPTKAVRPTGTLHLTLGVMSLTPSSLQEAITYLHALDLHVLLRDITYRRVAEKAAEDGTVAESLNAAAMPDTDALTINLESLVPMQEPRKTSILYAEPRDASQRLGMFASVLREQFMGKGLLVKDDRPLRLHATILNTIYAKPRRSGKRQGVRDVEHRPQQQDDDNASLASNPTAPPDPSTAEPAVRYQGHRLDGKSWMRFDARDLIEKYKDFVWAENVRVDRVCICKMGAKKIVNDEGVVVDEVYEVVACKGVF